LKTLSLIQIFTVLLISVVARISGANEPLPTSIISDDPVAEAVFAEDTRGSKPEYKTQRSFGLTNGGLSGWGPVYRQTFAIDRSWWVLGTYKSNGHVFLDPTTAKSEIGYANIEETRSFRLILGADQTLHVTKNKHWGFIFGAGVGLNHSDYQSTYHPQICTWYCGADLSRSTQKDDVDFYAFLMGRIGLVSNNIRFWGADGNLLFTLAPTLARWPKEFSFTTPDGNHVNSPPELPFLIEATLNI
jgi:hypothetical protein